MTYKPPNTNEIQIDLANDASADLSSKAFEDEFIRGLWLSNLDVDRPINDCSWIPSSEPEGPFRLCEIRETSQCSITVVFIPGSISGVAVNESNLLCANTHFLASNLKRYVTVLPRYVNSSVPLPVCRSQSTTTQMTSTTSMATSGLVNPTTDTTAITFSPTTTDTTTLVLASTTTGIGTTLGSTTTGIGTTLGSTTTGIGTTLGSTTTGMGATLGSTTTGMGTTLGPTTIGIRTTTTTGIPPTTSLSTTSSTDSTTLNQTIISTTVFDTTTDAVNTSCPPCPPCEDFWMIIAIVFIILFIIALIIIVVLIYLLCKKRRDLAPKDEKNIGVETGPTDNITHTDGPIPIIPDKPKPPRDLPPEPVPAKPQNIKPEPPILPPHILEPSFDVPRMASPPSNKEVRGGKFQTSIHPMNLPPIQPPPLSDRFLPRQRSNIDEHRNKQRLKRKYSQKHQLDSEDPTAQQAYNQAQSEVDSVLQPSTPTVFQRPRKKMHKRQGKMKVPDHQVDPDLNLLLGQYNQPPGHYTQLSSSDTTPKKPDKNVVSPNDTRERMAALLEDAFSLISPRSNRSSDIPKPLSPYSLQESMFPDDPDGVLMPAPHGRGDLNPRNRSVPPVLVANNSGKPPSYLVPSAASPSGQPTYITPIRRTNGPGNTWTPYRAFDEVSRLQSSLPSNDSDLQSSPSLPHSTDSPTNTTRYPPLVDRNSQLNFPSTSLPGSVSDRSVVREIEDELARLTGARSPHS
uniref:uncharacterized protein LOC100180515 isoform X2 n=1 Tax=Ciona intestinalis TaxID=7719 RepID=UPI000EF52561|nr:uncharacterized protein LOC100180515 isoform X2 [Ciona intestinalis]|eukprot:XP_026690013.1 uncharacterized protein LOC100180515 isoform X2 [Ciona intestinalis]